MKTETLVEMDVKISTMITPIVVAHPYLTDMCVQHSIVALE
jgi:hypothetical protein